MSSGYREKGRAVVLATLMVLSVVAMTTAFAGSAAADVTDIDSASADDIETGESSTTGQITLTNVNDDGNGDTLTIPVSDHSGIAEATDVSVSSTGYSDTVTASVNNDGDIEVSVPAENADANIVLDVTYDTSGVVSSENTESVTVSAANGGGSASLSIAVLHTVDDELVVNGDGGAEYTSISAALTAADDEDTITVAESSSDYQPSESGEADLNIDKEVTLQAADGDNPVISEDSTAKELIGIQADNVAIDGFTIESEHDGDSSIVVDGTNAEIVDNTFTFDSGTSTDVAIETAAASLGGPFDGVSGLTIDGNTFQGGSSGNAYIGVYNSPSDEGGNDRDTDQIDITDNTFSGSISSGIVTEHDNVMISGNTLNADTSVSSSAAITVQQFDIHSDGTVSDVTVDSNTIAGSEGFTTGISVGDAGDTTMDNLVLTGNDISAATTGIDIQEGAAEVTDNTVSGADTDVVLSNIDDGVGGSSDTNEQIQYLVDNNDITTTNPYGIEVTPTDVTVGNEETVEITILGRDSNNPRVTDVPFEILDADGNDPVADSTTSSNSFSTLVGFNEVGDYEVILTGETDTPTETITSTYAVANFETDPVDPAFSDTVTLSGQVVNGAGDGVDVGSLDLININDDNTEQVSGFASTTASGNFSGVVNVDDAAAYAVGQGSDIFAEFTVDPQQANVTLTAGDNEAGFEQTYDITLKDGSGNQLDFSNVDGFVNVTGPFDDGETISLDGAASSGLQEIDSDDTDDVVEAVRIQPDADADDESISLTATPVDANSDITATLKNNGPTNDITDLGATVYGGAEDDTITTYDAPDYVGSDSLAVNTGGNLNTVVTTDGNDLTIDAPESTESVTVTVRGVDGNFPDGNAEDSNDLANATVSLSGPGVDRTVEEFDSSTSDGNNYNVNEGSNQIVFTGVSPNEAGNITVEISARANDGTEYTADPVNITATGDKIASISPTSVNIEDNDAISVQVTDADDSAVYNREVTITQSAGSSATLTVYNQQTDQVIEDVTELVLDGSDGEITVGSPGGTVISPSSGFSPTADGTYTAENVTFTATGDFDVTVDSPSDDSAESLNAISVTGAEAYEVSSNRSAALAGANEVHTLNVTEDGEPVNGTDLSDFTSNFKYSTDVTEVTGPSTVDLDGDGTNDALQVEIRAENASVPANITIDDGNSRTGMLSLDVVEPDITTTLGGDDLTFGLVSEMNVTVEDPRDGSAIGGAEVALSAVNASFQIDDLSDGSGPDATDDGSSETVTVNDNGTRAVSVAPEQGTAGTAPQTLNVSTSLDTANGAYGEIAIETGNITLEDTPEDLEPSTDYSLVLNAVDANGDQLDLLGVTIDGALDGGSQSKLTDEGFINFDITTTESGTITYTVDDSITGSEVDLVTDTAQASDDASFQVASTNVYEQVNLTLSANATDIAQNDTVEFTLTREDFDQQTQGNLTISNASGAVVDTVSIDGTATYSFDEAGEFTVEASKPTRTQVGKTFLNDTVDVSVGETPAGSVTINDQESDGSSVNVSSATYNLEDFVVVIHNESGDIVGSSGDIAAGEMAENLTVDLDTELGASQNVTAMLHFADENSSYGSPISIDGDVVQDEAFVNVSEDTDEPMFELSDLEPTDATIAQGDNLTVSANVTNVGGAGEATVALEVGGSEVTNMTVQVGADATETVTFENISTNAIAPGSYTHAVTVDGNSIEGNLTVETSVITYTNDDGVVTTGLLSSAIDDWRTGDVGTGTLSQIIDAWRTGDSQY
ncbi:beta strand repeat-containing protein [Halovenus marina]|uniref:beta strand repeat-containing protein n=1 Tax=Halovenus marina TaxID=3396621 RepID=UPI003F567E36